MGTFIAIPRPPHPISTSDSEKKEFQSTNLQPFPKPPSEPFKIQEKDQIPQNSVSSTKLPAPQTPNINMQQTNNQQMNRTTSLRGPETTPKPPRKSAQQQNPIPSMPPAPPLPIIDGSPENEFPQTDFGMPLFFKKFVSYLWLFIIGILGFFL